MNGITALIVVSSLVSSVLCGSCTVELEGETNYNQDEMVELTCRWVMIDDPINKLEIREKHSLIYYDTTAYNTSFFRVCDVVKTIDEENHKDYTYTVRARSGRLFNGKTFTCQCGSSTSSKTLSVSDTTYGDCSGTSTSVSVVYENGTTVHKKATAPTYITPCGVVENQIVFDCVNNPMFTFWVISFTKPSACTRRLTLWGWNDQTDVECQLDVTADVSGGVHTIYISKTNFPKCTDGSATKIWDYVVKLKARSGTWLDQARISSSCTPAVPNVLSQTSLVLILVIAILILLLVALIGFLIWITIKFKLFSGSNKRLQNEGAGTGDSENARGDNQGFDDANMPSPNVVPRRDQPENEYAVVGESNDHEGRAVLTSVPIPSIPDVPTTSLNTTPYVKMSTQATGESDRLQESKLQKSALRMRAIMGDVELPVPLCELLTLDPEDEYIKMHGRQSGYWNRGCDT